MSKTNYDCPAWTQGMSWTFLHGVWTLKNPWLTQAGWLRVLALSCQAVAFDICVAAFLLQMLNPTLLLELSKLKSNKGMLALDYWVMRDPVCTMFLCCPVSSTNLFCPCLESHFFLHSKEKILHYLLVLLSLIIARKCWFWLKYTYKSCKHTTAAYNNNYSRRSA